MTGKQGGVMGRIWARIRRIWSVDHTRRELDDEMAFHIDAVIDDLVAGGMDPRAARREAVRRFGNPERIQEKVRVVRGFGLIDEMSRNLRFALRGLRRDPIFTTTFVLTLGLTVGLGTLAFAVGDSALWRPLPYPSPDRLAQVVLYDVENGLHTDQQAVDGATWERFRDGGGSLQGAVHSGWGAGVNLGSAGSAARAVQQRVGAGYFKTLGVQPVRGREFTAAEDVPNGPAVAILSHGLWAGHFGSEPSLLGGTVRLKGDLHTVVGIMPEGFRSPAGADVWTPLQPSRTGEGGGTNYGIIARVPEGMSFDEANARAADIPIPDAWAERPQEYRYGLIPLAEALSSGTRTPVLLLLGGIGLMLLVGWANLAGLQIGRTLGRRAELATRRALGSGSAPLVRQMAVENLLLAALGWVLGLALARLAGPTLEAAVQSRLGAWQPLMGMGALAAVSLSLTFVALLAFAAVPLLRAARPGLGRLAVTGSRVVGRERHAARKALLVGQMAAVAAMLFGAGLLTRSYGHLNRLETGFEPEGVLSVQYSLDDTRYSEATAVQALFRETVAQLEHLPEVASAAVSLTLPYERPLNLPFLYPGDDQYHTSNAAYVTDGFFETLRIPILSGRTFDARDAADSPITVVVNQAFVDRYLGDRVVLGSTLEMRSGFGEVQVVGVVGNVQQSASWGATSQPVWETPTLYLRAEQMPSSFFQGVHIWFAPSWVVRGADPSVQLAAPVAGVFQRVAPGFPVSRTATLSAVVADAFAQQRFEAGFLVVLAGLALLLAGIGLYGIVAQEVLERRGEMGIRMALGASPSAAVRTTAMGGITLAGAGLLLGLGIAILARSVLENLIWGVGTLDPVTIIATVGILGGLAAAASVIPAARVGRMNPAGVLREE